MGEENPRTLLANGAGLGLGRPNRFEVDLDAIAHNATALRRLVGREPQIYAALKADAYGYGIVEIARTLLSSGVDAISLVSLPDAIKLRHHGVSAPVLLYGGTLPAENVVSAVDRYDFMPTVLDLEAATTLSALCRREVKIFVKVDVGLERLGIAPEGVVGFVKSLAVLPRLKLQGVYAHLHVRGEPAVTPYLRWQFDRFTEVLQQIKRAGFEIPIAMAASTAVLEASTRHMNLNAIDPGRVFYGLDQRGPELARAGLRSAFRALKSTLIQVKPVVRAEFRDSAPFPIRDAMRIGIIPMGQYDGMNALTCGRVLVRDGRVNVLAISIEHSRIDLTDVPQARVGDEIVIIGRQGNNEISPDEVARYQGLLSAGMVALAIRDSIPRIYLRAGRGVS